MGYLGLAGGPNPCALPFVALYLFVTAFKDSPYGINHDLAGNMVPYLIDPVTLEVDYFGANAISGQLGISTAILDDATMVTTVEVSGTSSGLAVISRSGDTISMGSTEETVAVASSSTVKIVRIDSGTIARGYVPTGAASGVIEFLSVGGGISSIGSTTFPTTFTPDSGGTPVMLGSSVWDIHHSDGSSWLIGQAHDAGVGGSLRQMVYAMSGSSITASYRTAVPNDPLPFDTGTDGSTECAYADASAATGYRGFYWDGSAGHFSGVAVAASSGPFAGGQLGLGGDGNELGPYLNLLTTGGPVVVSQSGATLTPSLISPVYRCSSGVYADGSSDSGFASAARHGPGNLACISAALSGGSGPFSLKPLTW